MYKRFIKKIRNQDFISENVSINFHFDNDYKRKTLIGGVASFLVFSYISFVGIY